MNPFTEVISKDFHILTLKIVKTNYNVWKKVTNELKNSKLQILQIFPDAAHQAQFERHQGHIKLDDKLPYHGTHGCLNYDLHYISKSVIYQTVKPTPKATRKK